ncbi:serine threonine-protein kinase [Dionaea muscipula]
MGEKPNQRLDQEEEEHEQEEASVASASASAERVRVLEFDRMKVTGPVGRGGKGVVFRVRMVAGEDEVDEEEDLALKVVSKALIRRKNKNNNGNGGDEDGGSGQRRVSFEQTVLGKFRHPLLPRLRGVLETDELVGYAIDYCPGGDLNSVRTRQSEKMFSDDVIRFYGAELVLALEYLHGMGIVYRDLKPENILIQSTGHLMLVDFDLATQLVPKSPPAQTQQLVSNTSRRAPKPTNKTETRFAGLFRCYKPNISPEDSVVRSPRIGSDSVQSTESDSSGKSNSFVGTEEYVAPEMITGDGHDFAVDWWCLGVVLYEMLYGATPFKGLNRKDTFYRVLTKSPGLVGEATPLRDLIRRLLAKDPRKRISLEDIKSHDFFRGIDWDLILRLSRPPFIPGRTEIEEGTVTEGLKGVDVEKIVRRIFGDGEVVEDNKNNNNNNNNKEIVEENLVTCDEVHWVEGLDQTTESHKFSFF